jgi:hypothetical protein
MRSRGGVEVVMPGPQLENARTLTRLWSELWEETGIQRPGTARVRNRIALLALGAKLLELAEHEERLHAIESALRRGGFLQ